METATTQSQPSQSAPAQMPPKNWLVESILATIFCCLPFGVAGIVNAAKVDSLFRSGDTEGATHASQQAAKWTKIAFIVGIVWIILYVLLMVTGVVGAGLFGN